MKVNRDSVLLVVATAFSICEGLELVSGPPGISLAKRQQTVQGWALVEDLCPPGNGVCGKRSCCPIDSYCDYVENTNSNLCCPTNEPCGYLVAQNPRCALDSWVMWYTTKDPICCMPGEIGVQPSSGEYYGHCVQAGASIAPGMMASTVSGSPAATTTANSGSSANTATRTATSSIQSTSSLAVAGTTSAATSRTASTATSTPIATSRSGAEQAVNYGGFAAVVLSGMAVFGALFM